MAAALLYDGADLAPFVAALQAAVAAASGADRTALNRILTAIGTWQQLPVAPIAFQQGDPDTRVIVLPSQAGNKQAVLDLFDRARVLNGASFLRAILKDARTSAVDPWVG